MRRRAAAVPILLVLLCLASSPVSAQHRPHALYFQYAGEGLGLSANLDVGLTQSLRLRGGVGLIWTAATFPVTATYLFGRGSSALEVGGGATVMVFPPRMGQQDGGVLDQVGRAIFLEGQGTRVVPVGLLGYRYHPASGVVVRASFTPLMYRGNLHAYGGLSLGFLL